MSPQKLSANVLLQNLGADKADFTYEVVVSTCSTTGIPNASPMGVRFVDDEKETGKKSVAIRPFKSTMTYSNLSSQGEAVINVTSDLEIFYKTAFRRELGYDDELKAFYQASKTVEPPRIKGCDAYIEVEVTSMKSSPRDQDNRGEALCELKLVEIKKPTAKLYCRAPYMLMEALIHATRVKTFISQGLVKEADELAQLIDHYRNLIHRVAPASPYENMVNEIAAFIKESEKLR